VGAPSDDRGVDAIGSKESEDIAFAPVVDGLQAFAEGEGGFFDAGVCVGAFCVGILVDDFWLLAFICLEGPEKRTLVIRKWLILSLKQEIPDINIRYLDRGV